MLTSELALCQSVGRLPLTMGRSKGPRGGAGTGVVAGRGRAPRQNRDFRLLWIGQTVSGLGGSMSSVAYPLIALALTHSAVDAGLVGLANTAPFVLLQLPAGLYVDRWNRRAILLLSDAGRALAVGGVCVLLFLGHLAFWELVAAAVVEGSLFVPFRLAQAASLRRVVPPDQLSDVIALNQGQSFGTSLAGQPIGGFLYSLRPAFPFLADAISYGASLLSVAMIRTPLGAPEGPQDRNLIRELREGVSFAWNQRFIRSTALLTVGSDFVINGLFLLLVVIVRQDGGSATHRGHARDRRRRGRARVRCSPLPQAPDPLPQAGDRRGRLDRCATRRPDGSHQEPVGPRRSAGTDAGSLALLERWWGPAP